MGGYEQWDAKDNEYVSHRYVCVATGYFKGFTTTVTMTIRMGDMEKAVHHFQYSLKIMGITNPSTFNIMEN